jgi:hypothetical protein
LVVMDRASALQSGQTHLALMTDTHLPPSLPSHLEPVPHRPMVLLKRLVAMADEGRARDGWGGMEVGECQIYDRAGMRSLRNG